MKIRAFLAAFGLFAVAALFAAAPATAAPLDLTARSAAYADDWPPGDLLAVRTESAVVAVREDLADPAAYRQAGPVSKASHLFTAAGRFAAAHRTTRPGPS